MADLVFNISKGRCAELYNRVDAGDPAASRLYVIPIDAGVVTDATLRDCDDFAAVISAGATERSANGWNRKTLTSADLDAMTPDDTNDRMDIDIPDQTWTAVTADAVTDLVICYAAVGSPTDGQLVPLTLHDFAVTPDGSNVVAQIASTGFYRAA